MVADPQQSARVAESAAMQDEMQALARKLLDLWQDHLSALAQDPTLMAQALKLMTAYSPFPWPPQPGTTPTGGTGFAPFPGPFAPGFPFGVPTAAPGPTAPVSTAPVSTAQAAGPAPAAAAPDAGAGAMGELRRRVAELEGRIAELEQAGAAKSARKRAPGARARAP